MRNFYIWLSICLLGAIAVISVTPKPAAAEESFFQIFLQALIGVIVWFIGVLVMVLIRRRNRLD